MVRARVRRARLAITSLFVLAVLGLVAAVTAGPAAASDIYTTKLDTPCISCHPGGIPPELNARGQAFADVPDHKANPSAAWATAVRAVPLPAPTSEGFPSVIVPIAVLVLGVGWTLSMVIRRRRSTT
jgi:hypothetical protein